MSGTKEGGKKVAITNKAKHGSDFYRRIGKIGGQNGRGHKFAHGKLEPIVIGRIGGRARQAQIQEEKVIPFNNIHRRAA